MRIRKWGAIAVWIIAGMMIVNNCSVENNYIHTPSMLAPRGPMAERIADLSWFMFILGGLIFIGVMVYLAYAIWGSRGYDLEEELQHPNEGNAIVLTWGVGFTALVLVVLFGFNLRTMRANNLVVDRRSEDLEDILTIDVIGHQWWWEVIYPEQGFETANEIYIPAGQPVVLRLVTEDVIHSLWVPELNGKLDLLPNKVNEMVIVADQAGEYWGECAEYCGTQHAKMKLLIIAQTEAEFANWLESQLVTPVQPEGGLAFEGQQIFLGSACVYCHNIEGTNASGDLGPDLTHIASRRTLGAGILENSTGNLAGWIIDSQAIKPGNLMPPMDLSGPELQAVLAYLKTLE